MTDERFNELFERHGDGGLSEADCREALEAFAADPARKAEFIRQLQTANLLTLLDAESDETLSLSVLESLRAESTPNDRVGELFELYCDDKLTEADRRELQALFADDQPQKLEFIRQLRMSNLLTLAANESDESLASEVLRSIREGDRSPDLSASVVNRLKQDAPENIITCPVKPTARVHFPARMILTLAACLVVALTLVFLKPAATEEAQKVPTPPKQIQKPSTPLYAARFVHLENAVWTDGHERALNEGMNAGFVRLAAGMAKIDFTNGASVTVTGPVDFEIVDAMNTRLHSGSLSANIPDTAHGFEVLTEAAQVVDLGTAFGVSVSDNGVTDIAVFEGKVEVKPTEATPSTPPQLLKAGKAVRAKKGVATLESAKFDPRQFEKSWRLAAGVVSMSGVFKFAAPGPWQIQKFEDDQAIVIFPEQNEVILTNALAVDVAAPGSYNKDLTKQRARIEKGTQVRSYLIQFNPKHRKQTAGLRRSGKIRFQGKIVGLIYRSDRLRKTDELLGIPGADYGKGRRGLEGSITETTTKFADHDALRFFDDQRSLKVGLETGRDVDQVRVLVEARPEKQFARARKPRPDKPRQGEQTRSENR